MYGLDQLKLVLVLVVDVVEAKPPVPNYVPPDSSWQYSGAVPGGVHVSGGVHGPGGVHGQVQEPLPGPSRPTPSVAGLTSFILALPVSLLAFYNSNCRFIVSSSKSLIGLFS